MNKKRGRPAIYPNEEVRLASRRKQNRINQQRHRANAKVLSDITSISKTNNWNDQYSDNIIEFFNKYDFDFFFTGTFDPTNCERFIIKQQNKEIRNLNEYLGTDLSLKTKKTKGLKSFIHYLKRYIQLLINTGTIVRCFGVVEVSKNNNYHAHVLMKVKDDAIDINKYMENTWLIGISLAEPIKNEQEQYSRLRYCRKELLPMSNNEIDKIKVDNWFFEGDFENRKVNIIIK